MEIGISLSITANSRAPAAVPDAPAELFPFPTLTGSSWTISNIMTFDGNDLIYSGGNQGVARINAAGGGDLLVAALTPGNSYHVAVAVTDYVDSDAAALTCALMLGTAVPLNINGNGVFTVTVVCGSTTAGLGAFRFNDPTGSLDSFKITDISVVAA